jgi:hypothetical protein
MRESLTYFEALTYIQSGIIISKDGQMMNELKINDLFFLEDDDTTFIFTIYSNE